MREAQTSVKRARRSVHAARLPLAAFPLRVFRGRDDGRLRVRVGRHAAALCTGACAPKSAVSRAVGS